MTARKTWVFYTVARLAFFIVPLIIFNAISFELWFSAIIATLIAASLSVIFLRKSRDGASEAIYEWRTREKTVDDIAEDEILDSSDEHEDDPATNNDVPAASDDGKDVAGNERA